MLVAARLLLDRWGWRNLAKSCRNRDLEKFSFCREVNFLSPCKIETWKTFGKNLFWQSDVKRRERFWLWATFRKAGKWEWMMFAALQIGSRMKLCRHTTWPVTWSCKHGAWNYVAVQCDQRWACQEFEHRNQSRWTSLQHFRLFAFFLALCNFNLFSSFSYCVILFPPELPS